VERSPAFGAGFQKTGGALSRGGARAARMFIGTRARRGAALLACSNELPSHQGPAAGRLISQAFRRSELRSCDEAVRFHQRDHQKPPALRLVLSSPKTNFLLPKVYWPNDGF